LKKKIVILGGGESGLGAAVLAMKQGFDAFLSDKGMLKEKYREQLQSRKIPFEEGGHDEARVLSADEIIKSPGIPDTAPLVLQAKAKGIPVISEIEFAARYTKAKLICITGSNGKTTTTLLTFRTASSRTELRLLRS
jgi:UDP-N-acetylmuramoylalanine--D-glutamate ligase